MDNGWNTKEADGNVMNLVERLKVPFRKIIVDLKEFGELQRAFMKANVMNIEIPTDHLLWALSYKLASDNKIKYIISGGNIATEGIMPESWSYNARDLRLIKSINKQFGKADLKKLPTMSLRKYLYYRFIKRIKIIELLDFYEYDREKAVELLKREYGYEPYGDKHCESIFTKWFQEEYLPRKFGIDKRKAHYSSLINSGQMTRDEAVEKLKEPIGLKIKQFENLFLWYDTREERTLPNSAFWWENLSKVFKLIKKV